MRVLIGCESSGRTREALRKLGIDAWSCDLLPADDNSPHHLQCDVLTLLDQGWRMALFHPSCQFLSSSGLHWNKNPASSRYGGRQTTEALEFVRKLLAAPIDHIAIENPTGCIGTQIQAATQYVQPYDFGDDASKKTGLWLKNLPKLQADPKQRVAGRFVTINGKQVERWANQTDSGQNRLGPSEDRWKLRSQTYQGLADAFAKTWADHLRNNK